MFVSGGGGRRRRRRRRRREGGRNCLAQQHPGSFVFACVQACLLFVARDRLILSAVKPGGGDGEERGGEERGRVGE